MKKNNLRPYSVPFRRSHTKSELDYSIKGYKILPDNVEPPADVRYISHMVSLRSLVEDSMKKFEISYFAHTFVLSVYTKGTHEGNGDRMRNYFYDDKLGLKTTAHTDVNCWKLISGTSLP